MSTYIHTRTGLAVRTDRHALARNAAAQRKEQQEQVLT